MCSRARAREGTGINPTSKGERKCPLYLDTALKEYSARSERGGRSRLFKLFFVI